ncbi:MAG: hypothetical protein P8123_04955 [bacterium]
MKKIRGRHSFALMLLVALLVLCAGASAAARILAGWGILPLVLAEAGRMAGMLVFILYPAFVWKERFAPGENVGETLLSGLVWNVWGWILVTSALKATGMVMTPAWLWGLLCAGLLPALFWSRGREAGSADRATWVRFLALALVSQLVIPVLFPKYYSWGIDHYWVAAGNWINPIPASQEINGWRFFGDDSKHPPIRVYASDGAIPGGSGRWLLPGGEAVFRVKSDKVIELDTHLRFYFSAPAPNTVSIKVGDGAPERCELYSSTPDAHPELWIRNYYRYAWQRMCHIPPGETTVRMRIVPPPSPEQPVIVEDYSGLDRAAFFSRARERWLFCEVGALYDMLDIVDPAIYMRRFLFPYMSGLIDRRPGYTVTVMPVNVWINMIMSTPFCGDDYGAMRTAALAKGLLLALGMFLFYRYRNEKAGIIPGVMLLFPIVASAVNIVNFHLFVSAEDHFFALILLLSIYWLERDRKVDAVAAAVILVLTRLNGLQILVFAYGAWAVVSREWKRPLQLLIVVGAAYVIYWGGVFRLGHALGCLPLWKAHLYDETWRFRFSGLSIHSYVRNAGTLAAWSIITSCFLIFPAFYKPDRISRALLAFSMLYLPLVAATRLLKVYYLPLIVMPIAVVACRNISQLASTSPGKSSPSRKRTRRYYLLLALMLLLGVGCIVYLLREPLVYPVFSANWPAWSLRRT